MKLRKLRHRTGKFFGWKRDRWARLGGRHGKKGPYGHFAGLADMRTRAEKRDADDRRVLAAVVGDWAQSSRGGRRGRFPARPWAYDKLRFARPFFDCEPDAGGIPD